MIQVKVLYLRVSHWQDRSIIKLNIHLSMLWKWFNNFMTLQYYLDVKHALVNFVHGQVNVTVTLNYVKVTATSVYK